MKPFDLQVNGYAGTDFCSDDLGAEELHTACEALDSDGVDSILATIITDDLDKMCHKIANLVRIRELDPLARKIIAGLHIEGPFLNPAPGYIGAHETFCTKKANVEDAQRLLEAGAGTLKLVTLAPEMDRQFATTQFFADQGVVVSAGHCNPTLDELQGSIDHGLNMVTHLGNGCPVELLRHDNIVQRFLYFRDRLWICFIPDGHHIPFFTLKNYASLVGIDRTIMVTDCISATGMGAGLHRLSGFDVEVNEEGEARRPGSPNLAGSTLTMPQLRQNLCNHLDWSESEIGKVIDANPREALGISRFY